ncbi:hypothetical protein BGZ74_001502 [Mortierella antarctica]|nr:hypothetical protein BGZ74_001502 [Mortierella antarctica]
MKTTPTTPPLPPIARLPTEILDLVFACLGQPSLAACVRVKRIWKELCDPRLWSTLKINNTERLERFLTDEAQLALSRNVAHIQELYIMYTSVRNIFAPFDTSSTTHAEDGSDKHHIHLNCTNLQTLCIILYLEAELSCGGPWDDEEEWKFLSPAVEKAIAAFIRRNPGLKNLELRDAITPETLLPLVTHSLPKLEILKLSLTYGISPGLAKIILENLPETIRCIDMTVSNTNDAGDPIAADKIQASLGMFTPRRHGALESLHLVGSLREPEDYVVFLPFLETCTRRLNDYMISGIGWVRQPQVKEALNRLGVVLGSIGPKDFATGERATDPEIAEHLSLTAPWTQIHLRHCFGTGPLAAAAIMDNGTHLQQLTVEGCGQLSSKDLAMILESTPSLRNLYALSHQERRVDPVLSAADLATIHWASRSLVSFYCRIVVPRPSCHEGGSSSKDSLAWEQCREIQRQVYRKLGEQTMLSHLGLGVHYYRKLSVDDPQYQQQCLEMTLESGLDELVGLTQLQYLNVSNMDHAVGIPELEWMDRSWPQLRQINGMFTHCVNPVPGAREWIHENRPGDWAYGGGVSRLARR